MRGSTLTALGLAAAWFACGTSHGPGTDLADGNGEVKIPICQGPSDCDDGDGCTTDTCVAGRCLNTPRSCDDGNPCTADRCEAGQCFNEAQEDCCVEDPDCDDGNFCTKDECIDGACVHGDWLPNCCNRNEDCDDNDECTRDLCKDRRCDFTTKDPAARCCTEKRDCLDGDVCTDDECIGGRCIYTVLCCRFDADCVSEDPCRAGNCTPSSECEYAPIDDCCVQDADCPTLPCMTATCADHACGHAPIPNCCTGDPDCGDPCRRCDIPTGDSQGLCILKSTPECCVTTVLDVAFSDLGGFVVSPLAKPNYAATPAWNLDGLRTVSAPTSLYFGDPATHRLHPAGEGLVGGRATRAQVDLSRTTHPTLAFQAYRSGSIVSSVDVLSVIVALDGDETVVWTTLDHPLEAGAFRPVSIDLAAFEGRSVSLILEFDSRSAFATEYEGVWVDDLRISGQCR